jgi:riboflavin kinase
MHLILRGEVRTGKSDFSYWLGKLEPLYTHKTGMRLFPGTLNVDLTSGSYPTPTNALRVEKD